MARIPRVVIPDIPHHVTQRGARRMSVFFSDSDYRRYAQILEKQARHHALTIWAYCLMPNHVHLIAEPSDERGLARPLARTHRRYAMEMNQRQGWKGHLWQERFWSFPMDERYALSTMRYVLLNPVRAGLVGEAVAWPYSSARAHVLGEPDPLVDCRPAAIRVDSWQDFLSCDDPGEAEVERIRLHGRTGRPLGSDRFIDELESMTGRSLRPRKVGRRARSK